MEENDCEIFKFLIYVPQWGFPDVDIPWITSIADTGLG